MRCGNGLRRAVAAAALCAAAACRPPSPPRPDLVLVTVDTLRADRLACYGGERDVGAGICSLGDAGTRYTWAFSAAPSTAPSLPPRDHRVTQVANTSLADAAVTVAEALAGAGYATAAFVGNPVLERSRHLDQGFEIYDDRMTRVERNRPELHEREASELTDAALKWASVVRHPFFLWVHYQDPHGPYEPPDAAPAWDPAGAPHLPVLKDHSGWKGIPAYQALPGVWSVPAYERRYAEEIRYLDGQLRRLFAGLAQGGQPLGILLAADHGEAFGEDDFYFAHGHSVGLDQIRVPLLWRPPAGAAAEVVTRPVSNLDVAPTLLRAAGIPAPDAFVGSPLPASELLAEEAGSERPIFAEHRVAVVVGSSYYARDREPFAEPVPDRISGGLLPPLPPRTAALGPDGKLPPYHPLADTDRDRALEALVAAFLARVPGTAPAADAELDPATREALRALGYLR
jgi:arylsulfatase A-like enzyme